MYKTLEFKDLIDASKSELISKIGDNDLCIFDIDGVFFKNIFDINNLLGRIPDKLISAFKKLTHNSKVIWIFTDRWHILSNYHFANNILKSMKRDPLIYKSSKDFLNHNDIFSDSIIYGAKKKSLESKEVVKSAVKNFSKVYYFAAQDFPWAYKDKEMLDDLDKIDEFNNLVFVDIRM